MPTDYLLPDLMPEAALDAAMSAAVWLHRNREDVAIVAIVVVVFLVGLALVWTFIRGAAKLRDRDDGVYLGPESCGLSLPANYREQRAPTLADVYPASQWGSPLNLYEADEYIATRGHDGPGGVVTVHGTNGLGQPVTIVSPRYQPAAVPWRRVQADESEGGEA